ncbi:hypothetical protein DFH09DRAFT_1041449, partial [Mycena vulgaris]
MLRAELRPPAMITLDTILPALRLAKAGATGIGIPGVELVINVVLELATTLSTMKGNKQDLAKLEGSLNQLINTDASAAGDDLKQRLSELSSKLGEIAVECKAIAEKNRLKQFFKSNDYKERIQGIKESIASHIYQFTFYGNISIEKSVEAILKIFTKEMLARLKCVPARYNADNTPNKCMVGTRVNTIQDILTRLTAAPNSSERVVMLSGSAGSGKSTIAKSVACVLAEEGLLAASFFFSHTHADRKEITHLTTTLAVQLAEYNAVFRTELIQLLETDCTGLLAAEPHLQFQKMFVQILEKIPSSSSPWVICLDALDECGQDRGQNFLRWLSDSIARIPAHIRFFLTGRPDVPSFLKLDTLRSVVHGIILDEIELETVSHDIELYVKQLLDGANWTTRRSWKIQDHDAEEITNRANGLFVFAATTVRYVLAGLPQVPPQESIEYLLGGEPLSDLNALYHRIVEEGIPFPCPGDRRAQATHDRAIKILSTILHLFEPLDLCSLAVLLEVDIEVIQGILLPLNSVIYVPDIPGAVIRIIHLSFRDYMTSHIQKIHPEFLCGTEHQKQSLASALVELMHKELRFNICDLPTSYLRNLEMPDFKWWLNTNIPQHLRYACRFWVDHIAATSYCPDRALVVENFLLKQFLFWLEVLSLLGIMENAPRALSKLILWTTEVRNPSLIRFATDAKRFIAFFRDAIILSAPHIYVSALALAPTQSEISKTFWSQFPSLLSIKKGQMTEWPATMTVLEGHTS